MADSQEANKHSGCEPTESGNIVTRYRRLLHRRCASLDLESAFKRINISQEIKPELCQNCKTEKCICPAFMPEMPCSSVSSMPTNNNTDDEEIPDLVENIPLLVLHPPAITPSDEEADWEVAAICSAPIYYWVKSRNTRRHRYYTYNSLDFIEENNRGKRRRHKSPHVQGHSVEH